MYIKETWIQIRDKGTENEKRYNMGNSDYYEPFTDDLGKLFASLQKEYGRCVSKVYIDEGQQIGWVFEKKEKFEDVNEYFTKETWVEVHDEKPTITTTEHFHKF